MNVISYKAASLTYRHILNVLIVCQEHERTKDLFSFLQAQRRMCWRHLLTTERATGCGMPQLEHTRLSLTLTAPWPLFGVSSTVRMWASQYRVSVTLRPVAQSWDILLCWSSPIIIDILEQHGKHWSIGATLSRHPLTFKPLMLILTIVVDVGAHI